MGLNHLTLLYMVFAIFLFILLPALTASAEEKPNGAPPVKCLMMGMGPHGESMMGNALETIKAKYPAVAITPSENLEDLKLDNLKQYDVLAIIQIKVENGDPPDYVKEGILEFLKKGGGLVVTHYAVSNTQQWRDSIDVFGAMWVSGKSTHNPYHDFRVDVKDEAHPIVQGVRPFITHDELYFNLLTRPDWHVIMTANEERFGHTVSEPMLATHYVYNARCVYFALGHDVKSTEPPEFCQILVQSIEWAACRR